MMESDLKYLLEAFGSSVSLEEIASAYSKAQRDVVTTAEILCNLQGSTSSTSPSVVQSEIEVPTKSDKSTNGEKDYYVESKQKKKKKYSVCTGTVSSMIARDRPPRKASSSVGTKPLKFICYEPPVSDSWDVKSSLGDSTKRESLHKGDDVIILKRLEDDPQHERYVGLNGQNVCKNMEQQCPDKLKNVDPTDGDKRRMMIEREKEEERKKLLKEALESLFSLSNRFELPPKTTLPIREEGKSRGLGYVVSGPVEDAKTYSKTVTLKHSIENEEDEDSYQVLRQAVKEHLTTMKAYYNNAVEAEAVGDHLRADRMIEQGDFFKKKSQEAHDRSAEKLLQFGEDDGEIHVNLTEYEPREVIPFLKTQLSYPVFEYLKILLGSNLEDPKLVEKKRLVVKLLKRGSIIWTEEDEGKVISIRLNDVPKNLSFAKNTKL